MDAPGADVLPDVSKNPLLCPMCHDYFSEPCLLQCYHTFCGRCLRGRDQDGRIVCPLCGTPGVILPAALQRSISLSLHPSLESITFRQYTAMKDGSSLPPADTLMSQLLEIANSENPPCANCDKRDRSNMHYCNTCGQALCSHCRENTHRAKMFASHEIMHMSKCIREPRRCPQHGEQFIMYSPVQHSMLCVNCFRDTPSELRAQCVDMETAHAQAAKRLERGQGAILDLQSSVRDGLIALKGLLDELRRNMEQEKHTINTFCQGMQEAMAKTHAAMIMEVQRQFESKERTFRAQLVALGTVMPVLQLHLVLCATFQTAANKYQFLELCPALLERLASVGQLSQPVRLQMLRPLQSAVIRTNYRSEFAQCLEPWVGRTTAGHAQSDQTAPSRVYETAEQPKKQPAVTKAKLLDGEGPFATHCRSFETTLRELSQQLCGVKERVGELHRDITALRKAQMPPLTIRYECVSRDCAVLDESLERQQQELDRLAAIFNASWEEQLWRLRVEQEVFNCQRADILTLRNELKHLSTVALQLEPYIKSLSSQTTDDQTQQHLQSLLEHIGLLQSNEGGKIPRSRSRILGQLIDKVRPGSTESRERSKSVGQPDSTKSSTPSQKTKKSQSYSQQQQQLDRLENHLKEKIHDIMCRRQSKIDHTQESSISDDRKLSKSDLEQITKMSNKASLRHHKKMGKSCDKINACSKLSELTDKKKCGSESDYQRISEATSQSVKALVHKESRSSPSSPKCKNKRKPKVYPYSDGEDNVFYNRHDSADSLSTMSVNSRRSSLECPDKTLVVVIGARKKPMTLAQKQRSWETFPPKRRHHICKAQTPPASTPLRKTDSFEGHEEAVKTLVAAVQETRRKPKSSN